MATHPAWTKARPTKGVFNAAYHGIEDLQRWAQEMGGNCLSKQYGNAMHNYRWECGNCLHQWEASWNNVKNKGSWCPKCNDSIREVTTRAAFQENFPGEDFAKDHKTIGMELDGYSPTHRLAFEHDGIQHRVHTPHFHREAGAFEAQQARDARKDELCDEGWITLIRVPDRGVLPQNRIRAYVREELERLGCYDLPTELPDDAAFYGGIGRLRKTQYLARAQQSVLDKGGALAREDQVCPTRTWPLYVCCGQGHEFETTYDNLERGRWCPRCAHTAPKTNDEMEAAAAAKGYRLVGSELRAGSGGRQRRYVTVQCPVAAHPPATVLWDNFKKEGRKACAACAGAGRGAAHRADAGAIAARLGLLGLAIEGVYKSLTAPAVFVCAAKAHRFTSTVKRVEMAEAEARCPACAIDVAYPSLALEREGGYGPDVDPAKTKLTWRCRECAQTFETTFRGLRIRKKYCRNKQCAAP